MSLTPEQLGQPLKVQKRIQETNDAVSLVLQIPESLKTQFRYQAGQFVTFFLRIGGETLNRSYSLSSSPLVDQEFKVTVKKVPGGKGSTFLCEQVCEGDTLLTTPPAGHFFKPVMNEKGVHFVLFAAGSGITPVYSILKTVLSASPLNHVTLLFGNRNESSIIYHDELARLAAEHASRLQLIHVLSQPSSTWSGVKGRISESLIKSTLRNLAGPSAREFYMCGPVEFMNSVRTALDVNGVSKTQIHEESFGTGVHAPASTQAKTQISESWTLIGPNPEQAGEGPETIVALLNGETIEVAAKAGQTILESLIEAGAQPPYSCMDGACMACLGKITQGRVYQEDPGILIEDNIKNGEALTCQAKPLSRIVKLSYDNL